MKHRFFWTGVFLVYAAGWTALLLVPDPLNLLPLFNVDPDAIATRPSDWDKLAHAGGYLILALLGYAVWTAANGNALFRWILLGGAMHGGGVEIAQSFSVSRTADMLDWLADLAGLGLAWCLVASFRRAARLRRARLAIKRSGEQAP